MKLPTEVRLLVCDGKLTGAIVLLRKLNPALELRLAHEMCKDEQVEQIKTLRELLSSGTI